jgi:hypothetical protein
VANNCEDYWVNILTENNTEMLPQPGLYPIDPDSYYGQVKPFYVQCSFHQTIISHDVIEELEIEKCPKKYCFYKNIVYTHTLDQIKSIIDSSNICHQDIMVCLYLLEHNVLLQFSFSFNFPTHQF